MGVRHRPTMQGIGRPRARWGAAVIAAVGVVGLVVLTTLEAALAGGSWLEPVRDRYEPGQTATLVGYTGGGQLGWIEDGPFYGYLETGPFHAGGLPGGSSPPTSVVAADVPVGRAELRQTGRGGWLQLRVSLTFVLPSDLAPAAYDVYLCNDPCTTGLGDIIGGTVFVGVDPPAPIVRTWPIDEPAILDMQPDGLIAADGQIAGLTVPVSAAQIWTKEVVPGPGGVPVLASEAATLVPRDSRPSQGPPRDVLSQTATRSGYSGQPDGQAAGNGDGRVAPQAIAVAAVAAALLLLWWMRRTSRGHPSSNDENRGETRSSPRRQPPGEPLELIDLDALAGGMVIRKPSAGPPDGPPERSGPTPQPARRGTPPESEPSTLRAATESARRLASVRRAAHGRRIRV